MSLLITIVCFAISAGMLISLLTLLKRSKKMKKLIGLASIKLVMKHVSFPRSISSLIPSRIRNLRRRVKF